MMIELEAYTKTYYDTKDGKVYVYIEVDSINRKGRLEAICEGEFETNEE